MLTIIYAIESLKSTFLPVEAGNTQSAVLMRGISKKGEQERLNKQLIQAARNNIAEDVKALIKAGADVNATYWGMDGALVYAVNNLNQTIVKALIKAGADVNRVSWGKKTPLIMAVSAGAQNIVNALIEAGAYVNTASFVDDLRLEKKTPLIVAISAGAQNIVNALIKAGADVNAVDQYGQTPLMWAPRSGNQNIVKALIEAGADVNAANEYGATTLTYALNSGNQNIIAAIQNAIAERQAGRAYKEAIVRASTFAESARKLSGQSIPYGMNARVLDALKPEVITIQFLIGGDFITAEELRRWNVQWDGRRGMTDEERQYIYDRVDPIGVMKHIEANIPAEENSEANTPADPM